jgi:hypothetical protein
MTFYAYLIDPPDRAPEAHVMTEPMCELHEWSADCWCEPVIDGIIPGTWATVVVHLEPSTKRPGASADWESSFPTPRTPGRDLSSLGSQPVPATREERL